MTTFLLDTHIWLWLQTEPERLGTTIGGQLADTRHTLMLSAASAWEISIKWTLGKLPLPEPPGSYVPDRMRRSDTTPLGVEIAHALHVATLPDHHRDPFDRILVAQAQVLDLVLVSADPAFTAYDVRLLVP